MAEPTPQTLRVFQMFNRFNEEHVILNYINNNQQRININYRHPVEHATVLQLSIEFNYTAIIKKLLDLGAIVDQETADRAIEKFVFLLPMAESIELMNRLINAGFPKEKMLILLNMMIIEKNKELLKNLLEHHQPLNINYKFKGYNALYYVIRSFLDFGDDIREIFLEMLRILIQNGANPNEPNDNGINAIEIVNTELEHFNPRQILRILQGEPERRPQAERRPPAERRPQAERRPPAERAPPAAPSNFKILWTGFSRADIDFTNMIFHQTVPCI